MTKSHQLISLTALVLSPLSYANNYSYDDEVASAANKANLVMQARIEAEKRSDESREKFENVLTSGGVLKETPKGIDQGYDREWKRQIYLQRTLNDKRNLDPISRQFGVDRFGNDYDQDTPMLETNNTDFYRNKITSAGGVAYYNNNLVPITDGKEKGYTRSIGTWTLFSGQLEAYQKPRDNCDAYGSAATGQSGRLYVRSQSAINVVKAGVSSRMKMTITSFDGSKTLDTYLSPNVHAAGKPNRVGEAQYFMRNVAAHTFDLGTKSMPVKVCIEIINSTSQPRSIRDNNFDIDPNEYLYVQNLADNWKKNEVAAGNVFAEDGAATWKEQYQVWARPLMTKYADMMWLGI